MDARIVFGMLEAVLRDFPGAQSEEEPILIFAFDKAPYQTGLRIALHSIRERSIFALFLPVKNIIDFRAIKLMVRQSDRFLLHRPFVDLGFDIFAKKGLKSEMFNLEYFTSIDYIVSLGRPL